MYAPAREADQANSALRPLSLEQIPHFFITESAAFSWKGCHGKFAFCLPYNESFDLPASEIDGSSDRQLPGTGDCIRSEASETGTHLYDLLFRLSCQLCVLIRLRSGHDVVEPRRMRRISPKTAQHCFPTARVLIFLRLSW